MFDSEVVCKILIKKLIILLTCFSIVAGNIASYFFFLNEHSTEENKYSIVK